MATLKTGAVITQKTLPEVYDGGKARQVLSAHMRHPRTSQDIQHKGEGCVHRTLLSPPWLSAEGFVLTQSSHRVCFHNLICTELDESIREHHLHPAACDWLNTTLGWKQQLPEGCGLGFALALFIFNNGCFSRCGTHTSVVGEIGRAVIWRKI